MGVQRSFRGRDGFAYLNTKYFHCIIFKPWSFELKKKNADFRKTFRNRTNICKGHKVFSEALDPKED